MKAQGYLLAVLVVIVLGAFRSDEPDVKAIRKQLISALDHSKVNDSLYTSLRAIKNKPALIVGYIGSTQALKAKHAWNPYYKLKYLNEAETSFEQAINAEPHNLELRLLRFSVEHFVPAFLGYTKHLATDKAEMLQLVSQTHSPANLEMRTAAIKFLIESKRCTPAENEILQKHLTALK